MVALVNSSTLKFMRLALTISGIKTESLIFCKNYVISRNRRNANALQSVQLHGKFSTPEHIL